MTYDSDGKRRVRELVIEVAKQTGCETFLDLWGGGESARMAAAAGLFVTSAERDQSMREKMFVDGAVHGYDVWAGNVTKVPGTFDFVFADFCGGANPSRFEELGALASKARRWLAITLSPDHQLDPHMQGASSVFTIPAWIMGATVATKMRLVYIARYVRNTNGTSMWFALLESKSLYGRVAFFPAAIAESLSRPQSRYHHPTPTPPYWASPRFAREFPSLDLRRHQLPVPLVAVPQKRCAWCLVLHHRRGPFCKNNCYKMSKRNPGLDVKSKILCQCGTRFRRKVASQVYCKEICRTRHERRLREQRRHERTAQGLPRDSRVIAAAQDRSIADVGDVAVSS